MIPLVDLKTQYKMIAPEIDAAIKRVIESTAFILGPEVEAFEGEFAMFCETKYAIGVSSGTDALHLTLRAIGIQPGDEVITTPFTFIATVEAITLCGAKPFFSDIDLQTYNIDPENVEKRITSQTKAIIPVHLYGQPAHMGALEDIAQRHNLFVVEDAAQAHGARYIGQRAGSLADAACFSFYPGKNLGAYGDAGMVTTNHEELAQKVKLLRDHGRKEKYEHLISGFGNRLDAIQAAILHAKLPHLEKWNCRRREIAAQYSSLLANVDVILPFIPSWAEPVWHQYVIRVKNRERVQAQLKQAGIATGVHYPAPLHLQPAYSYLGYHRGDFPHSEAAADEVLSLPMYPELSDSQINYIVASLKTTLNRID